MKKPTHDIQLPPVPGVIPIFAMKGEDDEDDAELHEMFDRAESYIQSFSWCTAVTASFFGVGVGKIMAIFLFRIIPSRPDVDSCIWIIDGDIPSAYLALEDCNTSLEAFDTYIAGMERWVSVARESGSVAGRPDLPPVNVPATPEWAEELASRLDVLKREFRPLFEEQLRAR
jgi:hypothetical protein